MESLGLDFQPPFVHVFLPPELEEELAKQELAFKGLKEDQILYTWFTVVPLGGKHYDVRVVDQRAK